MNLPAIRVASPLALLAATTLVGGCASTLTDHLSTDSPRAQVFEGMGAHQRTMTTDSAEAQEYFGQGIAWMYAFNHDEAIRSFARAAEIDPEAPMPWWGISLCEGPNYNDAEMTDERSGAAWGALQEALARIENTSPLERALVEALSTRYAKPWPEDRKDLEQAYANAMAKVWAEYPDDSDVGTLYAEALMVQRPWMLYDLEGNPEGDTPHIVETLERVMEMDPANPGAAHLYIHAIEASKEPGRATAAADRLVGHMPAAGHLNHMPSHIYVQVGEWDKAVEQNRLAMVADDAYRALSPDQGLQHMYMVHNSHMLAYSAMMVGREAEAMEAARAMWEDVPEPMMKEVAAFIDLWMTSVYDVQKRFGRWDAILAEPAPPEFLQITSAGWHAHRAIAFAAKKDFESARKEQTEFRRVKGQIPEDAVFYGDPVLRILEVSDAFVEAEIALQQEKWDEAIDLLEKAVEVEISLAYGEPPQWLQPTRHTLGAVYLKAGRFEDAERVYRADLAKWPGNGWSLYGMSRALAGQGKSAEAREFERLHKASWAKADEPITTSCMCLPNV